MKIKARGLLYMTCAALLISACQTRQTTPSSPSTHLPPSATSPTPTQPPSPSATALPLPSPTASPTPTPTRPTSGEVILPDVSGLTLEEAEQVLAAVGLPIQVNYSTGQDLPIGTVVKQRPAAGEVLQVGQVIRIYVSAELVTISAAPGLQVGKNSTYSYPVELNAGVPYLFYTQDTFNITDNVEWSPLFNCCGRMSIAPVGVSNAGQSSLVFMPEETGSYSVVIKNDNPVRFSFTLVIAYYSLGE